MKITNRWLALFAFMCAVAAVQQGDAAPPVVTGANLTYQIDVHDINNDGGATSPGDGNNISSWSELTTGVGLNTQGTPSYQASAINGGPAVRFDGGAAGGDLVSHHPQHHGLDRASVSGNVTVDGVPLESGKNKGVDFNLSLSPQPE